MIKNFFSKQKAPLLFLFVTLALILAACGTPEESDTLQINDIWARPGFAASNSAVYFEIDNSTSEADTLLSASSDIAQAVELHMSMMDAGVMKMMQQHDVPLPVGQTEFKPGGLHVMLIGLNDDLNTGDTFDLTLEFQLAGEKTYTVTVKEP